jgi:metallophosphoesterase superfamily enzyme
MNTDLPITPDLFATPDRFLWHPATRTAILADLHLTAPFPGNSPTRAAFARLAARNPARVILAGDLVDLPELNESALAACRDLFALLPTACRLTLTPGNHDPADLVTALHIDSTPAFAFGRNLVSHGKDLLPAVAETSDLTWIVGHQHPMLTLHSRVQSANLPCYAVCEFAAYHHPRRLIVLPVFSRDPGSPRGLNLRAAHSWLLPLPRPAASHIRIFGLIDSPAAPARLLDFGPLAGLH